MNNKRPDQEMFESQLLLASFQAGLDRRKWMNVNQERWPNWVVEIKAADRTNAPQVFAFKFNLENYPEQAPTAQLWDVKRSKRLDVNLWPKGNARFCAVFNPQWREGEALYLPCDRLAIQGHDNWKGEHPELIWNPQKKITFYLDIIYDYLNSSCYSGLFKPAP